MIQAANRQASMNRMNHSSPPGPRVTERPSPLPSAVCPITGRPLLAPKPRLGFLGWLFSGMGLVSLIWFLVRVIPKPIRATYPCQRIAAPVASSFVVWLLGIVGSAVAWRKARQKQLRWKAALWIAAAVAACAVVVASLPTGH